MARCKTPYRLYGSSLCVSGNQPVAMLPVHQLIVDQVRVGSIQARYEDFVVEGEEAPNQFSAHVIRYDGAIIGMRDARVDFMINDGSWGPYEVIELFLSNGLVLYLLPNVTHIDGVRFKNAEYIQQAGRMFLRTGILQDRRLKRPSLPQVDAVQLFEAFLRRTASPDDWGELFRKDFKREHDVFFGKMRTRLSGATARMLKAGDVLLSYVDAGVCQVGTTVRFPDPPRTFQWLVGGAVSDGRILLPAVRPHGTSEWNRHKSLEPLKRVTTAQWPLLLRSLIGSTFDGFTTVDRLMSETAERERAERETEPRVRAIRETCFNGTDFQVEAARVSLGRRILFSGTLRRKSIYVVDGVSDTAIYVFADSSTAMRWASAEIGFEEARAAAEFFTPHTDGWENRVRSYLAQRP